MTNPGSTIDDLLADRILDYSHPAEDLSGLPDRNPTIISFYAEKGGVGKTTLCTTLAYTLAANGKRVLIYDCDVQCSLTAWIFGNNLRLRFKNKKNKIGLLRQSISSFCDNNSFSLNLYEQLTSSEALKPAHAVKINENLYLVIGDRKIHTIDEKITNTEAFTSKVMQESLNFYSPNNMTGMPYHAIMRTAKHYKIDYVFLDMNPYPGTLNRCLIMSSHYLIIPASLDFFCQEMMHNMVRKLQEWQQKATSIAPNTKKGIFPWPDHSPKFLGYILNKFMVYNKREFTDDDYKMNDPNWSTKELEDGAQVVVKMRRNEEFWAKSIQEEANKITLELGDNKPKKLAITTEQYGKLHLSNKLGEITEFHGLGDLADLFHTPVPFLEDWYFVRRNDQDGFFYYVSTQERSRYSEQRDRFRLCFRLITDRILSLIDLDASK